jgi:N-acetylglucosaminyldiphosphoundecaprenol N-acetyl-beta-D-mannosaminyltransferase
MTDRLPTVQLLGMPLARVGEDRLLDHMFGELRAGRGGWLVTANLDHLRRHAREPELRALYRDADVIVADGMPLVWATRVMGKPLPERVAGSALIYRFAERAALEGRTLYLLGGAGGACERASRVLTERYPGLRILGYSAPMVKDPPTDRDVDAVRAELLALKPDFLLVGLGAPKQERLISALLRDFPATWMVGVGISFSFVAGDVLRAPAWVRRSGLEWAHRLSQEPRRLAKRYLVHDLPFAAELFARVMASRFAGRAQ